jgi:type IV pilus assembly protein PilM
MKLRNGNTHTIVGLDIEADAIAATAVRTNGHAELAGTGVARLAPGIVREGEVQDPGALSASLREFFSRHKLPREVRLGVANQRVAVRTITLPLIEDKREFEAAVRFQAQEHIPMPLDQAILDWQIVQQPQVPGQRAEGTEVIVVAARREMVVSIAEAVRSAGLKPIGIDHSAFALIRALAPAGAVSPAVADPLAATPVPAGVLYCNVADITNLAVARGTSCVFTRVSGFGLEGIAQTLAEGQELTIEHAHQWLNHVGLDRALAGIDGDTKIVAAARRALEDGVRKIADEVRVTLDFYRHSDQALTVDEVVVAGPGIGIPGLVDRMRDDLLMNVVAGRPQALSEYDDAEAGRLTLAYGLGLNG